MHWKSLALLLAGWNISTSAPYAAAQTRNDRNARPAAKVKTAIERLGVGEPAHIKAELYDKTKLSGLSLQ